MSNVADSIVVEKVWRLRDGTDIVRVSRRPDIPAEVNTITMQALLSPTEKVAALELTVGCWFIAFKNNHAQIIFGDNSKIEGTGDTPAGLQG